MVSVKAIRLIRQPCLVLNKTVETSKVQNKRFCKCPCGREIPERYPNGKKRSKRIVYLQGHHLLGENNPRWNGGGRKTSRGYVYILTPDHPYTNTEGYVAEHRLVMEEFLGRYLEPSELVHHINHNRSDNRIENLGRMTRIEHSAHHRTGKHHSEESIKKMQQREFTDQHRKKMSQAAQRRYLEKKTVRTDPKTGRFMKKGAT